MSVGRSPCHIMLIAFQACEVEQWQDPACFFKHETLLLLLSTGWFQAQISAWFNIQN